MKKIDTIVMKETCFVAVFTVILSILMQAFFLIFRSWSVAHLLGNLLGAVAAVGNFFLMGLTVQKAVTKEEKEARSLVKLSQSGRLFLLFLVALIGYLAPCFQLLTVIIPFIFPRIAVSIRAFRIKPETPEE